jgi:hypothetical protein
LRRCRNRRKPKVKHAPGVDRRLQTIHAGLKKLIGLIRSEIVVRA